MGNPEVHNQPPENANKPRIPIEQIKAYFRENPDEIRIKRDKRHEIFKRGFIEALEKSREVAPFAAELGIDTENENSKVLSKEEEDSLESALDEVKKENPKHVEVCRIFLGSIKNKEVFAKYLAKWNEQYEQLGDQSINKKDFIKQKGAEFLHELARKLRENSVKNAIKDKSRDDESKIDAINSDINAFVKANYEKLRTGSKQEKDALKSAYFAIFKKNGVSALTDGDLNQLFEDLLTNITFEYLAIAEYRVLASFMMEHANDSISQEQWEELLKNQLDKAAEGELKEYIVEQQSPAVSGSGVTNKVNSSQEFIELGSANNFVMRPVAGENGVFTVDSPLILDKKNVPVVKLAPDGLSFEIETPFADRGATLRTTVIKGKQTPVVAHNMREFRGVVNAQILEQILNTNPKLRIIAGRKNLNELIKDKQTIDLAQHLFGFNLNERSMEKRHANAFLRLLEIIANDSSKGQNAQDEAIEQRIQQLNTVMEDKNNAQRIFNLLGTEGAIAMSVDNLIKEAKIVDQKKKEKS